MKLFSRPRLRFALSLAAVAGPASTWAQPAAAPLIRHVKLTLDGQTDIPRTLDLLGVRENDAYSEAQVEGGLVRLATSGKFRSLRSAFDNETGELEVILSLVPRASGTEARLSSLADEELPSWLESDVMDVIGLSPGDPVLNEQLPGIRERVQTRLADRGYPSAQVIVALEQREDETGPRVVVTARLPKRALVEKLVLKNFIGDDVRQIFSKLGLSWRQLPEPLQDPLGDNPTPKSGGKARNYEIPVTFAFDSIRIDEAINEWSRAARELGYYDFAIRLSENGTDRVTLELDLNRGRRYDIQFRGNVAFWERQLRDKVVDRPVRLGVPFSLQEAQTLVTQEYQRAGFVNVTVTPHMEERGEYRRVRFDIQEGRKFLLGPVIPYGAPEGAKVDLEAAIASWLKLYRDPMRRLPYDERFLKAELPKLLAIIRSKGFLDVKILEARPLFDSRSAFVTIELPMQLGDRYRVRSVEVIGNVSLTQREIDRVVKLDTGEPVNPLRIFEMRDELLKTYQELGFLDARIDDDENRIIHRTPGDLDVDVEYVVDQGPLIVVGGTVIEGIRRTKDAVVLRELGPDTLQTGHVWTPSGTDQLEQNLLNLSIFGSVNLEPIGGRIIHRKTSEENSIEMQEKDLRIQLTERPAGSFEFGPGFRTDKGIIGFTEINYRNLGGWNRSAQARAQVSRKLENEQFLEQNYSVTYLEPYIFDQRIRLRANTQYDKADNNTFTPSGERLGISQETISFQLQAETELTKNLQLIHKVYKIAFNREFNKPDDLQDVKSRVATIGPTLIYDRRDNVFNPSRGWITETSFEYSAPAIGSRFFNAPDNELNFATFRQGGSAYLNIGNGSIVALSAAYTRIWSFGPNGIPSTNRPKLGGNGSIRALPEKSLSFEENGIGDHQVYEATVEYRQPIFTEFGVSYFVDMGEIDATGRPTVDSPLRRYSTGMRTGLGVGAFYKTPIGPITVYLAYNTNPKTEDEGLYRFNLNIGGF